VSPICPQLCARLRSWQISCDPERTRLPRRARGTAWYAKYRLPDGRQVQKKIGPAWTKRGRPPNGYFTKPLADDWLRRALDEARRGVVPGMVQTGATFADAAAEWLRYVEHDRKRKPSRLKPSAALWSTPGRVVRSACIRRGCVTPALARLDGGGPRRLDAPVRAP
jgi:hypothetical protein